MRQSCLLLQQLVISLNLGPVKVGNRYVAPPRNLMKTSMESLIAHFKFFSDGTPAKSNEAYASIEAPKGEFGVFLVSDGSSRPYRCKFRAPGFFSLQAVDQLARNHLIADLVAIIGTIDIVFGEIDR